LRVLLVDDDLDILHMVERYLAASGMDVVTANSAFGVSSLVSREDPSVIVLDVNMPGLDGESLAALLAGGRLTRDVSVVFYSAMPVADLNELTSRVPNATFVSKGAGLGPLRVAIERAAGRTPLRASERP